MCAETEISRVAKILGVQMDEPFNIVVFDPIDGVIHPDHEPYRLTKAGLVGTGDVDSKDLKDLLYGLLTGMFVVEHITDESTISEIETVEKG